MIRLGVVTDNQDPENLRRIRVVTQDRGASQSQWVQRVTGFEGEDSGVPGIGSTVIIASLQGDTSDEVILGVLQTVTTNQPQSLKDGSLGSRFLRVLGDTWQSVAGYWEIITSGKASIRVESPNKPKVEIHPSGLITLSNSLGNISLNPTGFITITDPTGTWGSSSSGLSLISPISVSITSPNLSWNGSRVAVVGGTDSEGDVTLS